MTSLEDIYHILLKRAVDDEGMKAYSDLPIFQVKQSILQSEEYRKNLTNEIKFQDVNIKSKRLAVYSHFGVAVCNNNIEYLNYMKTLYTDICILTNIPELFREVLSNDDTFTILYYDYRGDFTNYYNFFSHYIELISSLNECCLFNDSMYIKSKIAFSNKISIEKHKFDVFGLSMSHQISKHIQSFFLIFNGKKTIKYLLYFMLTIPKPVTREDNLFIELKLSEFFEKNHFKLGALYYSYNIYNNPTAANWKELFYKTGFIKRQHFLRTFNKWNAPIDELAAINLDI